MRQFGALGGGRRKLVRLLPAIAIVALIAGAAVSSGSGQKQSQRRTAESPDSLAAAPSNWVTGHVATPARMWGYGHMARTAPLRTLKSAPYKYIPHEVGESESYPG